MGSTHSVRYVFCLLGLLFAVAFAWRMDGVMQWPMPFHPMLQYENALNSRAMWYQWKDANEEERQWVSGYHGRQKGLWLQEGLTALTYLACGEEVAWVSGVWGSLIWMVAALLLFDIAWRELQSKFGAFATVSLFLLHPFSLVVSRSFQHESGMMLGYLFAWWWLSRHDVMKNGRQALVGAGVWGLALLCKPGIGWLPLCFVHLAYCVKRHGWRTSLVSPWLIVVPVIALLPSLLWMKFILVGDEIHQWKWSLLLNLDWYSTTWSNMTSVLGWLPVLVAIGVALWQASVHRWFSLIVLAGYLVYAMVFNYANMTHDYYLLPLLPIVALAWGQVFRWVHPWFKLIYADAQQGQWWKTSLKKVAERQFAAYVVAAVVTGFVTFTWNHFTPLLTAGPYAPQRRLAEELTKQLGLGTPVIALSPDYAMPLRYFSGLHAQWWPTQGDLWYEGLGGGSVMPAKNRLDKIIHDSNVRYFIITLEDEYLQQKDLVQALSHYSELPAHPSGARIFELKR